MTHGPTDAWTGDLAYESYIGRWSRRVAPRFLRRLPTGPPAAWLDVGCGTGALTQMILSSEQPIRVCAVDPSEAYLAVTRRGATGLPLDVAAGSATSIPAGDGEFDRVVSGLVLNFVPQPESALAEMRRVSRAGGLVAAYVRDYADGMQLIRRFWDAAVAVDPTASDVDEARRFPLCRPGPLRDLFDSSGLVDVRVEAIDITTPFTDFEDLWRPFLGGQGPAPGYCAGLPEARRTQLRDELRGMLPERADGSITLTARAWAVRGTVP